jgi:hypothetical protein
MSARSYCCLLLLWLGWANKVAPLAAQVSSKAYFSTLSDDVIDNAITHGLSLVVTELQNAIPVTPKQVEILKQQPFFSTLRSDAQKTLKVWWRQYQPSTATAEAARACFSTTASRAVLCQHNRVVQIMDSISTFIYLRINNFSVQYALDHGWVPPNEKGSSCADVRKGHFYYYPTLDHDEVAYIHRTDSTQQESRNGTIKKRRLIWHNDCAYRISALEADDSFEMDFKIIHVASDHYLFVWRQHPEVAVKYLYIGRVNKSLE